MKDWYKRSAIYQIYPKTFQDGNGDGIGDLRGIINRIPYLKQLGIDAIWLSPIYASPMNDNGYDVSDYRAINPMFGTMADFDELVVKLHQVGLKLIMDFVANHTSSQHPWFQEAMKSRESKYHHYYLFKDQPNNWTSFFGGSAWKYNEATNDYYLHLFDQTQPDLNWDNPDVRDEIKDILKFWLQKGVDGFRLDVINVISKKRGLPDGNPNSGLVGIEHYANGERLHEYLQELNDEIFEPFNCFTVGECGFQSLEDTMKLTNHELTTIFNFEHFSLDSVNTKWEEKLFKFSEFKAVFSKWQHYSDQYPIWNCLVLENHDQPRSLSRYGNVTYSYASATVLAAYLLLQKGTPFIYQGEELGMTNYPFTSVDQFQDVESLNYYNLNKEGLPPKELMKRLNHASRDHARTVMQWDDTKNAGFSLQKTELLVNPNYQELNVWKDLNSHYSVIKFYQTLLKLRKENDVLISGHYEDYDLTSDDYFIYKRFNKEHTIFVVGNFSNLKRQITLPFKSGQIILNNLDEDEEFFLPYQVKVYLIKNK